MFHWICPECGREIPPSVRECQTCDPAAAVAPMVDPVVSSDLSAAPISKIPPVIQATEAEPVAVESSVPKEALLAAPPPSTPLALPEPEPVVQAAPTATKIAASEAAAPAAPLPVVETAPITSESVAATELDKVLAEDEIPSVVAEAAPAPTVTDEVVAEKAIPAAEMPPVVTEAAVPAREQSAVVEAVAINPVVAGKEIEPLAPEVAPIVAEAAVPLVEQPPVVEAAPIVSDALVVEEELEPLAPEVAPVVVEAAAPVLEQLPVESASVTEDAVETEREGAPPAEIAPVVAETATPVAEPDPIVEAVPVAANPVVEAPAAEVAPIFAKAAPVEVPPVAELPRSVEAAPAAITPGTDTVEHSAVVEAPSVEAAVPVVPQLLLAAPVPWVADHLVEARIENAPASEVAPSDIKLQDVPDPLLALAEEIRAAQAARAAALAATPSSAGLLGLAEAVGVEEPALAPAEIKPEFVGVAEKTQRFPVPTISPFAEAPNAVALLAPPEPSPAEPITYRELRPAALAPDPQQVVELQPVALPPENPPEPEGPALPLAPMQDYKAATSRSIQPVPPKPQILAAETGPRITLPGPTLPPELTRLQDANVLTVMGEQTVERTIEAIQPARNATPAPGWLVSGLVMVLLLAIGLGVVFYLLPHTVADAKPSPTPASAATAPAPAGGNSSLAKVVEVTGFRIVTPSDANKKSEVQYLVVNHSDAAVSDANVFVTLRSAKPGQAPVCRFSFKVPTLAAFESKEMSSPIEKGARAISLPDWQDLRAEVQIGQ